MNVAITHVAQSVWRQRWSPYRGPRNRLDIEILALQHDATLTVIANKVTPTDYVEKSSPCVGMNPGDFSRFEEGLQNSNTLILEENLMVFRRGNDGIEILRSCSHSISLAVDRCHQLLYATPFEPTRFDGKK